MKKLHKHEFDEYLSHIVYIKYKNGNIDDCSIIKQLWNYKVQLINSHNTNLYPSTSVLYPNILSLNKNTELQIRQKLFKDNLDYVSKSLNDLINPIYDNIDYISEMKSSYKNDLNDTISFIIIKLENGYLHSLEGSAFLKVDTYGQYGIYGEMMDYKDWKRHPLVRKQKIEKICSKLETM